MTTDLALPRGVRESCTAKVITGQGLEKAAFSIQTKEDPGNRKTFYKEEIYSLIYQIMSS